MSDDLDQRTLPPTPRRIAEFRRRGEVALSRELSAAATLGGGAIGALWTLDRSYRHLASFMQQKLSTLAHPDLGEIGMTILGASAPAMIGALAGWLLSTAVQLGWPPVLRSPTFAPRFFSLETVISLLSPKAMAGRAFKASAKVVVVLGAAVIVLLLAQRTFAVEPVLAARPVGLRIMAHVVRLFMTAGGALVLLGVGDYLWVKRQYNRRLRMTPEEMRREFREQEGDPAIKRKRRQRMRELAKRRLSAAVKSADVVVVNPTEYAVALRYVPGEDRAPRVVAKGRGPVAERIREMARQAGVPILPEPPLARLLHKSVPEGREIPSALYHAVAEVLAYVYRLRQRRN